MSHDKDYFHKAIQLHENMRAGFKSRSADKSPGRTNRLKRLWQLFYIIPYWILVWLRHQLKPTDLWPDVIIIYAPSRTQRLKSETDLEFLNRITRSNQGENLLDHLNIASHSNVRIVALLNGLSRPTQEINNDNMLSLLLSLLRGPEIFKFFRDAFHSPGRWKTKLEIAVTLLLARACNNKRLHLVMLTSNSVLVELFRVAITGKSLHQVSEVLHGISDILMEPYYDFFEQHAKSQILYINLIKDLPQFKSIERKILSDTQGQVSINVQLNADIQDSENVIILNHKLVAERPLLIIGGFSHDPNYLKSGFFRQECLAMQHLRYILPDQKIIYSPHPQVGKENAHLNSVLQEHQIEFSHLSTLELILYAKGAVGTFSTSVFEAALLECPVLLLPFKHNILLPALLELPAISIAQTTNDIAPALVSFCKRVLAHQELDFEKHANLCQSQLGIKLVQSKPQNQSVNPIRGSF